MKAWPMAEMQKQINSVREAFSADIRKPFVLKLPYGSPQLGNYSTTPRSNASAPPGTVRQDSFDRGAHLGYSGHPVSPPVSAGQLDTKSEPSPSSQLAMMAGQPAVMSGSMALGDTSSWNPSRIFAYVPQPKIVTLANVQQAVEYDVWYASSPVTAQLRWYSEQYSKSSPLFRCPGSSYHGRHPCSPREPSTGRTSSARATLCCGSDTYLYHTSHVARVGNERIRRWSEEGMGLRSQRHVHVQATLMWST